MSYKQRLTTIKTEETHETTWKVGDNDRASLQCDFKDDSHSFKIELLGKFMISYNIFLTIIQILSCGGDSIKQIFV